MPSGKTHDIITVITIPAIASVLTYFNVSYILTFIVIFSYLFSSFMFNGDLDIKSKPYKRWFILKFIWIPYQKIFKHRSIYTHGYIIGTIIRLIYLSIILLPIFYIFEINLFHFLFEKEFLFCILGLELGAATHSTLDYVT